MILRPFVRRCLSISVYFRQRDGLLREAPRQRHALYPRGRGQWGSRVTPRGSFISTNGPASHRISVIDALVRPKKGPSDGETRPKATAFYRMEAYEDRRAMRMTARKPKRTAARKRTTARRPKRTSPKRVNQCCRQHPVPPIPVAGGAYSGLPFPHGGPPLFVNLIR
jgi:hypothetical protein